jgi:hypothetical protein
MKHITYDDQLKESHAVIEIQVFDRVYMFCPGPTSRVLRDTAHAVRVDCFSRVKDISLQVIATFFVRL